MNVANKVFDRICCETEYCMTEQFIPAKDKLQKEIESSIMKTILLVEKQLEEEAERK